MKTSSAYALLGLLVWFQIILTSQGTASPSVEEETANEGTENVQVSKACAAALLSASGAFGATAAAVVVYAVLPVIGFGAVGVEGGSFAAWWQSTMPLVAKGSAFASLQSIAMTGGAGAGATAGSMAIGGALGGATGAAYVDEFCTYIDQVGLDSVVGKALSANLKAVQTVGHSAISVSESLEPYLESVKDKAKELSSDYLNQAQKLIKERVWNT